jgi:hypothetical protein
MPLLKTIVLSDNNIRKLQPEVFSGLEGLKELYLQNNSINSIHRSFFEENHNLSILDLSHNNITHLRNNFNSNTQIKFLNLSANMLKVESLSFLPITSLQSLDLSMNQIETLNVEVFERMADLKHLNISGNPLLEYDCEVQKLWTLCSNQNISCITEDDQSFRMVDNLQCEKELKTVSFTDEPDGFINISENGTEDTVTDGSGMEPTERISDDETREFKSTESVFVETKIIPDGGNNGILIMVVVFPVCFVVILVIVVVIGFCRRRGSREDTDGKLSRTYSVDYLNQEDQFNRSYKKPRNDNNKMHNQYDRVISPVLQFQVGNTMAAEVVRVPSFKNRGVAAPLNLPEEISLQETQVIIQKGDGVAHRTNQSPANSLSRSNPFPYEDREPAGTGNTKYK